MADEEYQRLAWFNKHEEISSPDELIAQLYASAGVRHPDASQPIQFLPQHHPICAIVAWPGEISAARTQRAIWGRYMAKESTPLWVWLSVALLAIGTVTYLTTVYFVEYILGWF